MSGVDGTVAFVAQADVVNGLRIQTRAFGPVAELPEVAMRAKIDVQVNEGGVLALLDEEQLRTETDAVIEEVPGYRAERDDTLTAMEFVDANHYVSAAMGCNIQWTAPLELGNMLLIGSIRSGESYSIQPATAVEAITQFSNDSFAAISSISLQCVEMLPSIDVWQTWIEAQRGEFAADYVAAEGNSAYYVYDQAWGPFYILVKPASGPKAIVSFLVASEGNAAYLDTVQSGLFVSMMSMCSRP
jgi:hypothetical protein